MRKVLLIITSLLVSVTIIAQEKTLKDNLVKQSSSNYKVDDIQATGDKVTIKDGSTILMEVINEGDGGSIYLEPLPADITSFDNKLYNFGTELYWSGDPLGTSRNVGWETSISTVRLNSINDKVGIGINSPSAKLHVQGDDGVLFEGNLNSGTIPKEGAGVRMMWYPKKAAFRSGYAFGTEWDDANIGYYSTAVGGNNTIASGEYSTAMGRHATASGDWSTAFGNFASASGNVSVAMGQSNATGFNSTALGASTASGSYSTAMGNNTKANSLISTAFGHYNVGGGDPLNWIETDPLFEIGNGQDDGNRGNALTVLKNGNVGIGTSYPTHKLEVRGTDGAAAISCQSDISWGIVGQTSGANVAGVEGRTGAGGNSCIGVMGNDSWDGFGVRGRSFSGYAGYFESEASATAGYFFSNLGYGLIVGKGNVGIGTVTPERLLHLNGANPRILIEASSSNPEINFKNNGDLPSDIWSVYKNGTTDDLQFYQNGNKVTIQKNTGNVGIGTTNPNSKLSIVGLSEYDDNAAALAAGLVAGDLYRSGDLLKIVH